MSHLTLESKMLYTELFLKVDAEQGNGDGALSIDEFEKLMIMCGHKLDKEQLSQQFAAIDKDGNWKITLDEYLAILPNALSAAEMLAAKLRRLFRSHDVNGDGYVTKEEMRKVMAAAGQTLSNESWDQILKQCDKDGDGKLNFEEFILIFIDVDDAKKEGAA